MYSTASLHTCNPSRPSHDFILVSYAPFSSRLRPSGEPDFNTLKGAVQGRFPPSFRPRHKSSRREAEPCLPRSLRVMVDGRTSPQSQSGINSSQRPLTHPQSGLFSTETHLVLWPPPLFSSTIVSCGRGEMSQESSNLSIQTPPRTCRLA